MGIRNIYDRLRAHGMTAEGALAMLGNWDCESNCEACRLQGDFSADRAASREYAARVDAGTVSRDDFVRRGPNGGGWGLAQWTYWTRKEALYDFARARGVSIAHEDMQIDFAVQELRTDFPGLWAQLCTSRDLHDLTRGVCAKYENPAVHNVDTRYAAALRIMEQLAADGTPSEGGAQDGDAGSAAQPSTEPAQPDAPDDAFWPPRMLCAGMHGADVMVLQALLIARGYHTGGVTGIFDNRTKNMVMAFQAEGGLTPDGIAGPVTFKALGVVC